MYCSSCGEEVGDAQSVSFCPNCGTSLGQEGAGSAGSGTAAEQTTRDPASSEVTSSNTRARGSGVTSSSTQSRGSEVTSSSTRRGSASVTEDLPLIKGAAYGAAAYISGYVLFAVLLLGIENEGPLGESPFQFVGWVYHNAQFVDIAGPDETFNYFDQGFSMTFGLPAILYRILPVVLLVVAGYLLVSRLDVTDSTTGAKFGATIAVGVPVMAAVGAFVFSVSSGSSTASSSPELLTSIIIIGIIFPAISGGIGGYLAGSQTN